MILVEYSPAIIDKCTNGQRSTEWVNKSLAVCIRKGDSLWGLSTGPAENRGLKSEEPVVTAENLRLRRDRFFMIITRTFMRWF